MNKQRNEKHMDSLVSRMQRPMSVPQSHNFSSHNRLGMIQEHSQTDIDLNEFDNDDTSDSDEDDKIRQSVKKMETTLNIKKGKTTKTWNFVKRLVSKDKHRYHYEGYDLDMSYILKNVIAMGFPSQGRESLYRNNMQDVKNFFNKKYGFNYKIYNLCTERTYK